MKEFASYIVNYETLMIVPFGKGKSKVFERDDEFIVNMSVFSIIKDSCLFFGSSFDGRREGTKAILNCDIKVPIIIEDSKNLIFFPTSSYRDDKTVWISYNNLLKHTKYNVDETLLNFIGNIDIKVNVRYNRIDNQIIRCIKLDTIISRRKTIKSGE